MVVDQSRACLGTGKKHWEKHSGDQQVDGSGSLSGVPAGSLRSPPDPPAVQIDHKDDIVQDCVGDGNFDARNHGVLLLALFVLFPWTTILLDHADKLNIARHDCGYSSNQSSAESEVSQTCNINDGCGIVKSACQELGLDVGCGQGI